MNRFLAVLIAIVAAQLSYAQTVFDSTSLRGLSAYEQLRTEYYLAGLYLPTSPQTADDALLMPGPKRMNLRVVTESWSPRRFAQQWNQQILINNSPEAQKTQSDNIIKFSSLLKDDLRAGDELSIDQIPNKGVDISLNGTLLMHTDDSEFFNVLLSCWVGARPPSSTFKQDMLKLPNGDRGADLLSRFEITAPTQARIATTKGWGNAVAVTAKKPEVTTPDIPKSSNADQQTEVKRLAEEKAREKAEAEQERLAKLEAERQRKQAIVKALAEAEVQAKAAARTKQAISDYSAVMLRSSYQNVRYPKRALQLGMEGTVLLEVVLNRDGSVESSKVLQSSGFAALDDAAISAVKKTAPFNPLPKEITGKSVQFTVPFTFQISG